MIRSALDSSSIALVGAGLFVLILGSATASHWRSAISVAVELWTAAGLLRLSDAPSWSRISSAGAIVLVRRLILARMPPWSAPSSRTRWSRRAGRSPAQGGL